MTVVVKLPLIFALGEQSALYSRFKAPQFYQTLSASTIPTLIAGQLQCPLTGDAIPSGYSLRNGRYYKVKYPLGFMKSVPNTHA